MFVSGGQLILKKIRGLAKSVPPDVSFFRQKCTKLAFRFGFVTDYAGKLTALPQTLAVFKGPTSKGGGREEGGWRDLAHPKILGVAPPTACKC